MGGAVRARASGNQLYSRTPGELSGMEVIGSDGESIGKIKKVVMDRNRDDVHAVISSGGIMGIGARETLLPLAELTLTDDDKVQARLTKKAVSERPEFEEDNYGVLESDRRISDFSAFEPTRTLERQTTQQDPAGRAAQHEAASRTTQQDPAGRAAQLEAASRTTQRDDPRTMPRDASGRTAQRADPDASRAASPADRVGQDAAEQARIQASARADTNDSSLHQLTPDQLRGMEVMGSDSKSIGKVREIVGKKDADKVYAVVSSGGFLGIGAREILIPLNELTKLSDDQLQARFGQQTVESHPQYQLPDYVQLRDNRPVSEFLDASPADSTDRPAVSSRQPD